MSRTPVQLPFAPERGPGNFQRLPEDREVERDDLPLEVGMDASAKIGHAFQSIWTALAPYLSSNMAETVFDALGHLRPNKQNLTLLFADIRGFTSVAELADPEECVKILNAYFSVAIECVLEFGGTVDKFQGDGIMATFSSIPGGENHERRAVKCALRLRSAMLHLRVPQLPLGRLRLGIGISTGIAAVGSVGSSRRMDYTAIGDVVNVAHRLQSISEPDQIIISRETCQRMGADLKFEALGSLKLKGRTEPVAAYAVCY
jgi:class 3 adenylate cyclase